MTLKLYNTDGRKVEEFRPIDENEVKMYSCGPTIYNYVHIGNLRAAISSDILKRYLKYKGYNVKHIMNMTDIDDKIIRESQKNEKSLKEFTTFYGDAFIDDLKTLNIEMPSMFIKATDEIQAMVDIVKKLLEKGYAYKTHTGDIYYKLSEFKKYGKMALIDPEKLMQNADGRLNNSDEYEKEDARDFALWKAWSVDDGDVFWETDLGKGRPGWHIECSAMSSKYLGQPFDIHTGGVDLIFPHHTNEIAQSEAAEGKKYCNTWCHNAHLIVNGEKMSKSLGNFFTLRDLIGKGYSPMAIRFELMSTHYRQKLDFRENNLENVKNTLEKIWDFYDRMGEVIEGVVDSYKVHDIIFKAKTKFEVAMDEDLNISKALASLFEMMNEINKEEIGYGNAQEILKFLNDIDSVLGIMKHEKTEIPEDVFALVEERQKARESKNWDESDRLRDLIKEKGFIVEDKKEGPRVKKN